MIEIGCVELIDRRITGITFHKYINPQRSIDPGALAVHGISSEFLADKPTFAAVVDEFLEFINGAELIIHNASFDLGFINNELHNTKQQFGTVADYCRHLDTLKIARDLHPGQRNSLDALCKRYNIDNANRELHGALLDAKLLALVYLAMTGGQISLFAETTEQTAHSIREQAGASATKRDPLLVILPDADELTAHAQRLMEIDETSDGKCVWLHDE